MLDGMTLDLAQGMTLDDQCLWCMSLTRTGMTTGTGMAGQGLTGTGLTGHGLTGTGLSRTRLIGTTAKAGRSMVAEATALSIGHGMTTIGGLGRRVWPCKKSSTSSSSVSSSPSSSSHWNWPKSVYVWHIFIQFVINQNHCFTLSQCMVRQCCPGPWCKIVARTIYNVCACLTDRLHFATAIKWLNIVVNYIIIISIY